MRPRGSATNVVAEQVRLGFDSGDVLVGGDGADIVDGGDGSDVVVGGEADSLTGSAATPVSMASLFGLGTRTVNVLVEGRATTTRTSSRPRPSRPLTANVPSDSQLDTLCESGTAMAGAGNSDFVTGGPEKDIVVGGNGADTLDGGGGPDEICGRAGDDQISGDGAADDEAEDNDDIIRGGTGNDRADGGPGDDVMFGDDVTLVRGGSRVLDGSLGSGAVGNGKDYLDGGDGDDVIAVATGPTSWSAASATTRRTARAATRPPTTALRPRCPNACSPATRPPGWCAAWSTSTATCWPAPAETA